MPSERIQRRIDALLDEADAAADDHEWALVIERAEMVLGVDADNADAQSLIAIARRGLGTPRASEAAAESAPLTLAPTPTTPPHPERFAGDRYEVRRHLGDGGTKRVFLVRDTRLDREVARAGACRAQTRERGHVPPARVLRHDLARGRGREEWKAIRERDPGASASAA